jgi:dienelactone hydrolase
VTASVDASGLLPGWSGVSGWLRSRWWGFGPERLPLNGRAWLPGGDGPFPLVLVVHGNHVAEQFSDAGYAYLGEHLASRGFIVVSVDENFLNRSYFADLLRPLRGDLEARAGLLLEHLARWRRWSQTPGDPLEGRVDLDRVALVGHSRGGEAVALATRRNREPLLAADGAARFAHGFGIRAVVALAPTVGNARPDREPLELEDVSYLVLHGSHDGDLGSFEGARQFEAVRFTKPGSGLKVAVWIEGVNHGQFNRDWGATDLLPALAPLVVRGELLPAREQEHVTELLVETFLGAVLQGERRLESVLRDPQRAAALPSSVQLRGEFQEAGFRVLADFEETAEPTAAGSAGAGDAGAGLRVQRVDGVEYRWLGERPVTRALHLGWERAPGDDPPHYALHLPPDAVPGDAGAILAFSLAAAAYARVESGRPAPASR